MAIEIRAGRADGVDLRALLAPLNHLPTAQAVAAERTVSKVFGGSCQIPLAAYAMVDGARMTLRAMVATPDGKRTATAEARGPADAPAALGQKVADLLQQQDAHAILAECKAQADAADA